MLILMGLLFVLGGCAGPEVKRPRRPIAPQVEAPPPPGLEELLVTQVEENRKMEERLLSFSVKGVEIKDVLLSLSKASEINIVFDPDIAGVVTVDLKDVTLAQALDIILIPLGLEFRRERNVIRVKKPELETRIFTIDYVNVRRSGSSSIGASVSAATTGVTGVTGATTGALGGGTTSISNTQDTDVFTDLEAGVRSLLSGNGKAVFNKGSGTLLVTDFPVNLRRVAEFLERFTGIITRQVFINAQVLEVALTDSFKFGIDWTGVGQLLGLKGAFSGTIATPTVANAPIKQRLSPNSGIFQISVTDNDFEAIIDAVSTQGEVNVLSNPKIAALNNQKAVIRVAREDVFFRTTVRVLTTGVVTPTTERVTETVPQTVAIGVILDVTPQIASDGTVTMHIHPVVTDKVGTAVAPTGETVPILSIKETDTVVKVRDGQTIIIGGLMEEKQDDSVSKVPLIGDIPLVGGLFRRTEKTGRKSELVILLSPTVLIGDRVERMAAETLERVEDLKEGIPAWPLSPGRSKR